MCEFVYVCMCVSVVVCMCASMTAKHGQAPQSSSPCAAEVISPPRGFLKLLAGCSVLSGFLLKGWAGGGQRPWPGLRCVRRRKTKKHEYEKPSLLMSMPSTIIGNTKPKNQETRKRKTKKHENEQKQETRTRKTKKHEYEKPSLLMSRPSTIIGNTKPKNQ